MDDPVLSEVNREVVLAFAECNMKIRETARKIFRHRNTVVYHLIQIKAITGLDPYNFYDLVKLVKMAKGETDNV